MRFLHACARGFFFILALALHSPAAGSAAMEPAPTELASGEAAISPQPVADAAEAVAKAEAEARAMFESNHYYFVTPHGLVDPTGAGLPPASVGLRSWSAFRGNQPVSEANLMKLLGRTDELKRVRIRRAAAFSLIGIGTAAGLVSASVTSLTDDSTGEIVLGAVGVFGGFGVASGGMALVDRRAIPLDQLYVQVQKLNAVLRENLRAQYRMMYGVPLEAPAPSPIDAP